MAFNYGYPYYQNGFQQYQYQNPQQNIEQRGQQSSGDGRIWVQGEVGAKAYLVAPGNTVDLWDSEQQVIWLKTVMPNGVPSMVKINYTFDVPAPVKTGDFITRDEFEKRIAELSKAEVKSDDE